MSVSFAICFPVSSFKNNQPFSRLNREHSIFPSGNGKGTILDLGVLPFLVPFVPGLFQALRRKIIVFLLKSMSFQWRETISDALAPV